MAKSIGPVGHNNRSVSVLEMGINHPPQPEELEARIAEKLDHIRKRKDIIEPEPEPEEGRQRRHITNWHMISHMCKLFIIIEWEN